MKDAARIDTAREIFTKAFTEVLKGRPADSIVTAEIKNRRYMGSSDRRAVTEMIWQSFRNTAKALWYLRDSDTSAEAIFDTVLAEKYNNLAKDMPLWAKYECPQELFSDAIMFSLFFKRLAFTNKGEKNYIMPFTAEKLGCEKNDLNVLFPEEMEQDLFSNEEEVLEPFDFRKFLSKFEFSKAAKDLYSAALEIFKFYHQTDEYSKNRDWNDSFYDITNAIM